MAHFTEQEARDLIPKWRSAIDRDVLDLLCAIRDEDWAAVHKAAVNLKWDGGNIASIALDLSIHTRYSGT